MQHAIGIGLYRAAMVVLDGPRPPQGGRYDVSKASCLALQKFGLMTYVDYEPSVV